MAWLCVDKDGAENIWQCKPQRLDEFWGVPTIGTMSAFSVAQRVELPKGTIKMLLGRQLKWKNAPVQFDGEKECKDEGVSAEVERVIALIDKCYIDIVEKQLASVNGAEYAPKAALDVFTMYVQRAIALLAIKLISEKNE